MTKQRRLIEVNIADMYEPGIIDLNIIDDGDLKGLVIFTTLNEAQDRDALTSFFNFSLDICSTLKGTIFLGEHSFSQGDFDLFESVATDD